MSKTYIIRIGNYAIPVLEKIENKYINNDKIVTVIIATEEELNIEKNNFDIKINGGFESKTLYDESYGNSSLSYFNYTKNELDKFIKMINKEDKIILYNSLINTGSLETYAYLCEKISNKIDECIAIYCVDFYFSGNFRRKYANDISNRIKNTKCKIIEIKESDLKEKYNFTTPIAIIDNSYEEYFKIIDTMLE